MATKEEKRELKKIKDEINELNEEKIVPLIKNNNQFKITIPKTFSDFLNLKNNKAKIILNKKEKKLIIEVNNG